MKISVDSGDPARTRTELLVVPMFELDPERWKRPARLAPLDEALGGRLGAALRGGDFRGRRGESLWLLADDGAPLRRVLLLGLGKEAQADPDTFRRSAGTAVGAARGRRLTGLAYLAPTVRRVRPPAQVAALAEGAVLGAYRFDRYKQPPEEPPPELGRFEVRVERSAELRKLRQAAQAGTILAESQNVARDLSNEPGNALPPVELAKAAQRVAREVGLSCHVMDVSELRKRKMGGILGVGQGSANPPRMIVLEHNAPPKRGKGRKASGRRQPTVCIVGKGITFDSGGISIKPAAGMPDMKHDMSGAATVVGALRAAALLKVPQHVVGIVAAAENMPSGTAYRPGDVLTTASGRTIEVLNTDAEGRVALADALHLAHTEYAPDATVDLATLTGACVVALGKWCSGLFTSDDRLATRLLQAGDATGERLWRLPLWEPHRDAVRGQVADVKNTGGRDGGAITAAAFLSFFAGDGPWAHLDIAGTAWVDKPEPYQPRGATGVGVRLLVDWLRGGRLL